MNDDVTALKGQYGPLYDELLSILDRYDPVGIAFVGPQEYSAEVATILPRLPDAKSVEALRRIIWEEFVWWFSDYKARAWEERVASNSAGAEEEYQRIAEEIWPLWMAYTARNNTTNSRNRP